LFEGDKNEEVRELLLYCNTVQYNMRYYNMLHLSILYSKVTSKVSKDIPVKGHGGP
jgi:hypothetical protein